MTKKRTQHKPSLCRSWLIFSCGIFAGLWEQPAWGVPMARSDASPGTLDETATARMHETTSDWQPIRRSFAVGSDIMEVLVWVPPGIAAIDAIAAIRSAQRGVEELWLRFDPMTEGRALEQLAVFAGERDVVLPPDVFFVLSEAKRVSMLSGGAYDPTALELAEIWDVDSPNQLPDASRIQQARERTAASDLWLDPSSRAARLARPGQAIAIQPLALAYAMDGAAQALRERGFGHFLIQLAGGVLVGNDPPARRWRLGLQDPRAPERFALWEVSEGAVMTTADYFGFVMQAGQRIHNVIDPRSGRPARGLRSVAVRAKTALEAKMMSMAFFVLGPDEGPAMLARVQDIEAVWVDANNQVGMSARIEPHLTHRPPTDAP